MDTDILVTATRSMKNYTAKVIEHVRKYPSFSSPDNAIDGLDLLSTWKFADGEMEVEVQSSIRGKSVILFASCARNEASIPVDEAKIELYHTIDALKRAKAKEIVVFEPYISCSRSDRTVRRSSVGLWIHLKTLSSLGATHMLTYQLHSDKSKSMLDPTICDFDDIPALTLIQKFICDNYIRDSKTLEQEVQPGWIFCSVDAGSEKIAENFANSFGTNLAVAHKQRDYSTQNRIKSISILTAEPIEGKILWIVDDMIDTGSSIETLIENLLPLKPAEINILTVHPVFSPNASASGDEPPQEVPKKLQTISQEPLVNRIIATDTIHCPESMPRAIQNLTVVPSTELSADIIRSIATNHSLSDLYKRFDAGRYLRERTLFT